MRPLAALVAALAAVPGALAVDQKKSAIIWFEDAATPDSVVDQAKESIVRAGGQITHVYSIIRGFAVVAPEKALEAAQAMAAEHRMRVEEDEMVSAWPRP